jgi:exonuclease VII large subunit
MSINLTSLSQLQQNISKCNSPDQIKLCGIRKESTIPGLFKLIVEDDSIMCHQLVLDDIDYEEEVVVTGVFVHSININYLEVSHVCTLSSALRQENLYKQYLKLKMSLDPIRRVSPKIINKIGLIISDDDWLKISDSLPVGANYLIYKINPRGKYAITDIVTAINYFSLSDVDMICIIRSPDNFVKLIPFSHVMVLNAINNCTKYVMCAVGNVNGSTALCNLAADSTCDFADAMDGMNGINHTIRAAGVAIDKKISHLIIRMKSMLHDTHNTINSLSYQWDTISMSNLLSRTERQLRDIIADHLEFEIRPKLIDCNCKLVSMAADSLSKLSFISDIHGNYVCTNAQ